MADPITGTAAVSMGMSAAGGILGGIGAEKSGQASALAYRYKAAVALLNKQINEQNARWALDAGEIKSVESGLKSRQEIANTKVAQSASGLDINSGSAEAVRDTQTEVAQFDQNVIRWDAKKTSVGYSMKAKADQLQADADLAAADSAEKAGKVGMLTSFLNAGGSVASKWLQGNTIGIFGGGGGGRETMGLDNLSAIR